MAIYHFSAQVIGRKSGRSAVAAAAYRAGEKIEDERLGLNYDYTKKTGVEYTEIISPENAPEWANNREQLWNRVEAAEKRSDAQLAREINVALPNELNKEQQIELTREFAKDNFVSKGMIADIAIHSNGNNPHAHIMLTTRQIDGENFGRKNREWNDKELLVQWRESWAQYTNRSLEMANCQDRIDHRTLKGQGIDREAQIHVGPHASAMEQKGIETDRGNINREIRKTNEKLQEIKNQKIVLLNEFKILRAEQRKANNFFKKFTAEERAEVLDAQKILKQYASLENIKQGHRFLDKSISFWDNLDNKLSMKMKNLKDAKSILENVNDYRNKHKDAPLFSADRKELRAKINELENEFKKKIEYIERYHNYGIKDEKSFEKICSKLEAEEKQKREKYELARVELFNKKEILSKAENVVKVAENRVFLKAYAEYSNLGGTRDIDTSAINKINQIMGRNLSYNEFKELSEKAYNLKTENIRLAAAGKHLDEYEKIKDSLDKYEKRFSKTLPFFQNNKIQREEYQELLDKSKSIKDMLGNGYFKVKDREDYFSQVSKLRSDIGKLSREDIRERENEIRKKEYNLYRYELHYEEARETYNELQKYKKQLVEKSTPENTNEIKEQIQTLQEKFGSCRVGKESYFENRYEIVKEEIAERKNAIEEERKQMINNVNVNEICDLAIKAHNSFAEINNRKFINEYYFKKDDIRKVVNDNERGTRGNEENSRRDPEADRRVGAVLTAGDRQSQSTSNQRSGYSQSLQRANPEGQREDSRDIQQDSGSNKHTIKDDRGQVLEAATRGIKEDSGKHEKQQGRNNIGAETNDRKISSEVRTSIFSKNSDSAFNSRFKSAVSNNIQNSIKLSEQLKKQIEQNKIEKEGEVKKENEKNKCRSKLEDRER